MHSASLRTPRSAASLLLCLACLVTLLLAAPLTGARGSELLTSLGSTDHAKPPTKVGFGVVPATAKAIDVRSLFSYGLSPGSVAYDHVAVVNYSAKKLDLAVYATDALNSSTGGYALRASKERPVDLGAWVAIGGKSGSRIVSVPGRRKDGSPGRVILPVSISVPTNATPGDHAAGVVASLNTLGKNPNGQNIRLEQRVASRVYVRVAGPLQPALIVTSLKARFVKDWRPWKSGSVVVTYTLSNTGNLRMGFDPAVTVKGLFGLGTHSATDDSVAELLPGNSRTFRTTVRGVWPTLRLDVTARATPKAAVAAQPPGLGVVSETIRIGAVTWWLLVALALLLGLLSFLVYRQIRRHRQVGDGHREPIAGTPKKTAVPASNSAR